MSSPVVAFPAAMRTILIVDDQPSVLTSLAYVFASAGYTAILASRGEEALVHADSRQFDAALVDLHMPVMDGLTLCRLLCERGRNRGQPFPVWMMTAAYCSESLAKALEAGARTLLKKPFDTFELIAEINTAIAGPAPRAEIDVTYAVPPPLSRLRESADELRMPATG